MAITGFQAEDVNSGGEKFAVFKVTADSFLYPVGFTAWGSSGSINVTSTAAPFPVTLIGGNSGIEFNIGNLDTTVTIAALSTASKVQIKNDSADAIYVRGLTSSAITISTDTTVTIAALTSASKIQVEPVTSSAARTFVDNNSAHPVFTTVKLDSTHGGYDATNSALRVNVIAGAPDTTITIAALSTTTIIRVQPTTDTALPWVVRGATDSTVPVSGSSTTQIGVTQNAAAGAGGATPISLALSSLAQTVKTTAARLYGYSVSNPDSALNVWMHIYPEDSAGVTLGTSSAAVNVMVPFGGGREAAFPFGITMSSGISVTASLSGQSTAHDAPSTTIYATLYFL